MRTRLKSPYLWVVLWLVFLGSTIWSHARRASQPPVYDAFSYYQKAQNLWANIHSRNWQNPFNVEPTVRPPGTVLMSYPFGFCRDFRGFYFRSSYLPILFVVLAVYLAGYVPGMRRSERWDVALLAILFSTLPGFYHFEIFEDKASLYWGMVDQFLVGTAALAAAALVRSVKDYSPFWLIIAALLAAFSLLIKPAGIFVMACIAIGWTATLLVRFRFATTTEERYRIKPLFSVAVVFVSLIYGIVGILCLRSNYLSGAGANFGKATISVMRAELNFPLSSLPALLYPHFGIVFPVSITLLVIAVIKCRKRLEPDVLGWDWGSFFGFALCAVFFLAVGIWFWIFWTGGVNQVRYFSPFALMSVICMVPVFITTLRTLSRTSRVAFRTLSLMAAATLAFLLVQKNPPAQWQLATGLDLSTDYYHAEIEQARSFLRRLQALNRSADIYSLSPNTGYTDIVESEFIFQSFLNPSAPKVFLQRPVDWQRPSAVRVGELLDSNYVLFDVVPEPERTRLLSANQLSGVYDEIPIFSAWFTGFTEQDGVKTICETAAVRLVEITNASKLEASILRLMKNREWSETFVKANPQRWWNRSELAEAAKESPPAIQDVSFGNMFEIHALSLKKEGNNINVQVWLVPLHHDSGARWFMFFHQIDAKGAIIGNAEFVLPEEVPGKPSETFLLKTTTFNVIDPQLVKTLGIGIHDDSPIMHTLPADKGTRDWGDHRILVPMPSGS